MGPDDVSWCGERNIGDATHRFAAYDDLEARAVLFGLTDQGKWAELRRATYVKRWTRVQLTEPTCVLMLQRRDRDEQLVGVDIASNATLWSDTDSPAMTGEWTSDFPGFSSCTNYRDFLAHPFNSSLFLLQSPATNRTDHWLIKAAPVDVPTGHQVAAPPAIAFQGSAGELMRREWGVHRRTHHRILRRHSTAANGGGGGGGRGCGEG